MADEFTLNINGQINKSPMFELLQGAYSIDVSAIGLASGIQVVGTSAEAVVTTDVSTFGWAFFQNMDATNFLLIGPDNGGTMIDFVKLKPGEPAVLRLKPGITIKAKADTLACKMLYKIFED